MFLIILNMFHVSKTVKIVKYVIVITPLRWSVPFVLLTLLVIFILTIPERRLWRKVRIQILVSILVFNPSADGEKVRFLWILPRVLVYIAILIIVNCTNLYLRNP